MNVTDLPEGAGMLFVFPEEKMGSFWMKDTLIPLDIAFFDANRRLVGCPHHGPVHLRSMCHL